MYSYISQKINPNTWKNENNLESYNSVSVEFLKNSAVKGGLDSGCDVDILKPYLAKANSVLELGAGYGRVLQNLILRGYSGEIVGVEQSNKFYQELKKIWASNIEIINSDIKSINSKKRFDLILFLWSGICDFAKEEQSKILLKIKSFLNPQGIVVLDTTPVLVKPLNASIAYDQYCLIKGDNNSVFSMYTPSVEDIKKYAKRTGLCYKKDITYLTATNRKRIMYILCKSVEQIS